MHEGTDNSANLTVGDSEQGESITLALLRRRVFTKSPVRENRTPGSVRGLSGNWQSYRDQLPLDALDGNAQFLPELADAVVWHACDRDAHLLSAALW